MVMKINKEDKKIQELLLSRKRIKEKIGKIENVRREEEADNEEAWPGHESTRHLDLEAEYQLLLEHLSGIESELKQLGFKLTHY